MVAAILLASLAFAGQTEFDLAISMASEDVGTDQFASSIAMAKAVCDQKAKDCVSKIAELRDLDLKQRAYVAAHPAPTPAPAKAAPKVQRAAYYPPTFVVDQPTGFEYVASLTKPPAPWTGVEVQYIKGAFPDADLVCLRKDGTDLPMGPEVPFADSSQKGTPVQGCHAAHVDVGQSIWVPSGTTVQIGTFDVTRQAYVVKHAYTCSQSAFDDRPVQERTIKGCGLVK